MSYVALCNATENFCSHYDCVGSPHDGKEINIDKKYVEEDLAEMKEKEDERIRKEKEEEKDASTKVDAKTVAADYVDLHIKGSEPGEDGEDHSHVYAIFLQCLWAMADDPASSLQISDVWDMLEKDGSIEKLLDSNPIDFGDFVDVMKLERRDVVE